MEFEITLPFALCLMFGSAIFTLIIFSFLVAGKRGDGKLNEIIKRDKEYEI